MNQQFDSILPENKKRCFVIMGFGIKTDLATGRKLNLDKSYQTLIKPVVESKGMICLRADEIRHSGTFDVLMFHELSTADLVIADLSTANLNAFYQLGVRHALRPRATIIMSETELNYPFDVNHIAISRYTHLGDSIDYLEVLRFQKLLGETIEGMLTSEQVDSPVYTFLGDLIPPSFKDKAVKVARQVGEALSMAGTDSAAVDDQQQNQTLSLLIKEAEDALKHSRFSLSKRLFRSALQIFDSNDNTKLDADSIYLIQRLAFATHKAKEPNEAAALIEAIHLLDKLDLKHTNDAETIGLAGKIERRLYLTKEGEDHLANAIHYYERAYTLVQDRYYGINLAFLLNCRADSGLSPSEQDKITDMTLANRIRKGVLHMCEQDWARLEASSIHIKEAPEDNDKGLLMEQREMEKEKRFWIQVNKAESYFGLGEIDKYKEARLQALEWENDQNMRLGFEKQVEKLLFILKKFGSLLKPVWSDEETDIEIENYDKLYEGASLQLTQGNYQRALRYINRVIELDDEKAINDADYFPHPQLYELKAKISTALGDTSGAKAALDRYEELNDENKFRMNLSRHILLDRLVIENLPFFGSFTWVFTPGMNILLGKNGYGKSHLLRLLTALLYHDKQRIRDWIPPTTSMNAKAKLYFQSDHPVNEKEINKLIAEMAELMKQRKSAASDKRIDDLKEQIDAEQRRVLGSKEGITSNIGKVPILAIPDSRFIDRSQTVVSNSKTASEDLKRDGATDFLYSIPFGPVISKGIFIVAQKNGTDFGREPYNLIQRVISELAHQRQPGAMSSSGPSANKPFFKFLRIESTSTTGDYKIYVQSEENNDEVLLNNISQGTFSVLSICLMIYRFLTEMHPESKNPLLESAIIFIDEIDAHLHPSWEQKIIGILRREFPKVQFIITGHSPLIVAGCLEREVTVIRHNTDGFALQQSMDNFIGYSTPELFRKIFEIEDKDDQYLYYSSLTSQEDKIKKNVEQLEHLKLTKQCSPVQQQELENLYKELTYIDRVKDVQAKEVQYSTLETQNILLRQKVLLLENNKAGKQ